jgi:hypothetical protein
MPPPVGFKPKIAVGERPYSYALDRAAIGTGKISSAERIKNVKGR